MSDFILRLTATILDAMIDAASLTGFLVAATVWCAILCGAA